ncbi:FkbM family methyltransferase [Algoriphagus sp. oki45]|uniref:FkbM family methyltransferase n=1 Tax=Algoriphagus sp. oki45 TaxID=3067294 RepID=UPI0030C6C497
MGNNPKKIIVDPFLVNSYSQYHEDLIIDSILNKENGFYVDIGANDPVHLSNTKRFYDKGWNGINIEPQSFKISEFNTQRERDINLNIGIGPLDGYMEFFELDISSLSSFNKKIAFENCNKFKANIKEVKQVPVRRLDSILNENLPHDFNIDFFSIDTEGFEMEVLESNNWSIYRPNVIIIEFGNRLVEINEYLTSKKYSLIFKNGCNLIYKRID